MNTDYVLLEGGEGCGKSSLAKAYSKLTGYIYRNEPSNCSELTTKIRELALQSRYSEEMTSSARELLMFASRSISLAKVAGLLNDGKKVIQDRGFLSGMVYAKTVNGINFPEWFEVHSKFKLGILPSVIVMVSCDERSIDVVEGDIYDTAEEEFHIRIESNFLKASRWVKDELGIHIIPFKNDFTITPEDNAEKLKRILDFLP